MQMKQWSDLSATQKRAVYVVGAVEALLTTVALADLRRRPAHDVRGSKGFWALASFVQPVGPIVYLLAGRH